MGDIADESTCAPERSASIFLQIKENPDGSITRPPFPLSSPPSKHPRLLIEDLPLNPAADTRLRLYLPIETTPPGRKLPVILFFHGGGFVLFGPDALFYDEFCRRLSVSADAVVVSASYRLAPEHRLPAAYEDGVDAVEWVRGSRGVCERIGERGDLSRLFVMGSSSGGNLAYHAGLHSPSKITGLILNQPYFGGTTRTKSEAASDEDPVLPLRANDTMWRLALPVGSDRDHEYCNPTAKPPLAEIKRLPRVFVKGSKGDPLVDRQRMFVEMLERAGADVVGRFDEDGSHAVELFDAAKAEALCEEVKEFVHGCC